jgi:hypothetical protein
MGLTRSSGGDCDFETARHHPILHPERIVGNPEVIHFIRNKGERGYLSLRLTASNRFAGFFIGGAAALGFSFVPELLAFCQSKL